MRIPPDLLPELVRETLSAGETFAAAKLRGMAVRAGLTPEEIEPQLAQASIGDGRKDLIGKLTPLAAKEMGVSVEDLSPSAAIAAMLAPFVFGSVTAYLQLAALAQERLTLEKARQEAEREKARETRP